MILEKDTIHDWQWTNNLRAIATVSVIFLHVSGAILYEFGKITQLTWWIGNSYDSIVRFCVPVFVMLSGALLFSKEYELKDFLRKRFSRIIIPFAFYNIIYVGVEYYQKLQIKDLSIWESLSFIVRHAKPNNAVHFWYIYMIIGLYLFIPIISKWIRNATETEILYFLAIWIVLLFVKYFWIEKLIVPNNISYFSGYMGYAILGYYLSIKLAMVNKRKTNLIAICLILAGICTTAIFTAYLSYKSDKFESFFYEYLTVNVLAASLGVFTLIRNATFKNVRFINVINTVSKYSYGIYLAHMLVLHVLMYYLTEYYFQYPIIAVPLITITCLTITLILVVGIHKLPYGKYISG